MSDRDAKNRQSLLLPVLIPVIALVAIGLVLFGFSRVLLAITHTAAWVVALIVAAGIMAAAAYVAGRKQVGGGSVLSMVGAAAGIAMLSGGVALFAAEEGEGEGAELARVVIAAPDGAAESGFAEDTREVTAPAGEVFELVFDNQDSQQPHNVVIAESDAADAAQLFREEPYTGPERKTWTVEPALAEGSYFFFCEVHPTTMTGTLEAVPGGGEGGAATTLVAENSTFDTTEVTLEAGAPSSIVLENRDAGLQHNVSLYRDEAYTDPIFEGELINGPDRITYQVPPLDPSTYYFRCDVHPTTMEGTVSVEGGAGPTGPTGSGGEQPAEPTGGG